ncbi:MULTISPECIES: hypothetical protein [Actinosynnema]|uniref:hypothetical protein n=1 Tax=Actinosynnema TaxID=40566 RepID=UPI0020A42D34|nr:hypothetical protein [Actinosynnema pretiosum]MCP2097454.1 hypothetical protein [Actinosynnema pretiosum]
MHPITSRLSDRPVRLYRWLYAFDGSVLRVFRNHDDHRWIPARELDATTLATFDAIGPSVPDTGPD